MGGEVLHRPGQRCGVCVGDRLGHNVIGAEGADERDALRCAEGQIEPVPPALAERASVRAVGRDTVVEPARHQLRVGFSPGALNIGQAHQPCSGVGVAGQQPCRGAGFTFG
jgi:hypothetical protein